VSGGNIQNHAAFIWSVADLLRGNYKQSEYGKVILPLVVIRRLDCVLEPTKEAVLKKDTSLKGKIENVEPVLQAVAGEQFYNTSPLDFRRLLDDPTHIADNLRVYINAFSSGARDVIDKFDFNAQVTRLDKANLLYKVIGRFADIDLHPETVSNLEMGYLYEELIRKFSELSNETAGEHFTPREVIRLMVNLLFIEDEQALTKKGIVRTLLDPACGTGGMLSVAEDHLRSLNPDARLEVFGQELNAETYAICRSDMMLKGQDASHIVLGNSFSEDGHQGEHFDYLLANPPFGVEWKNVEDEVKTEAATTGFSGRFGAGLPRINDGSFLFLQHMISKMKPASKGERFGALALLGGYSGLRWSELIALKRDDIDLEERKVRVDERLTEVGGGGGPWAWGLPKTSGSARTVDLPAVVVKPLAEHFLRFPPVRSKGDLDGLVFHTESASPVRRHIFRREWRRACERANVPPIRLEWLRHTGASLAYAASRDMKAVASRLGHTSTRMVDQVYVGLYEDAGRELADAIDALVRQRLAAPKS
jgi:methylase of polypeptide subunit release factors